jgi:serine/threonine protein kinase
MDDRCGSERDASISSASSLAMSPEDEPGPDNRALETALRQQLARPSAIGPYRIVDVLGEGGMGTVYLAEEAQTERRVALKVIKLGMDTRQVLRRFETERRTLAAMNHDAIAKVFAVGITSSGQPYFAMEYVEGEPIDDYCERNQLGLDDTLRLVAQVCAGVQHAHQKTVVHRDLKPKNLLASGQGGEHRIKIIDFGIARALSPEDERTLTGPGQVLGTPEYMAPEQWVDDGGAGIVLATDVYALGVILYQLLTGHVPRSVPRGLPPASVQELLREAEPPLPSARLLADRTMLRKMAARFAMASRQLLRVLRRDLDWIVAKAMRHDAAQRYDSPASLAADLQRFLAKQPIEAAAPRLGYRLGKLLRRHRQRIASALAVLAVAGVWWWTAFNDAQAGSAREHMTAARLAQERGLWNEALHHLDSAAATGKVDPVNIGIGRLLAHLGNFDDARATAELRQLASMSVPADQAGRLRLLRGLFANRMLDPEAGLGDVRSALTLGSLSEGERSIGMFLLTPDLDKAREELERALARDPHDLLANMAKVSLLFCTGDAVEARRFGAVLEAAYPNDDMVAVLALIDGIVSADQQKIESALRRMRLDDDEGLAAAARQVVKTSGAARDIDELLVRLVFDREEFGDAEYVAMTVKAAMFGTALVAFFRTAQGDAGPRAMVTLGSMIPPCFRQSLGQVLELLPMALRIDQSPPSAEEDEKIRQVFEVCAHGTDWGLFRFICGFLHAMRGEHEQAIQEYERATRGGSWISVVRSTDRGLLASRTALWRREQNTPAADLLRRAALVSLTRLLDGERRATSFQHLLDHAVELAARREAFAVVEAWQSVAGAASEQTPAAAAIRAAVDAAAAKSPALAPVLRAALR